MGAGTGYCHYCRKSLAPEDFESGKAVTLLKRSYCEGCVHIAVEKSKQKEASSTTTPAVAGQTPTPFPSRRRHERKECSIVVELAVYLESGKLYDRGQAQMWNVSLSGALLRALLLPTKALPLEPHYVGIRLLEGELAGFEIVGRPVRLAHSEDGLHLAIEFSRIEDAKTSKLRKLLS